MDEALTRSPRTQPVRQPDQTGPEPTEVTWRELRPGLWVGRSDGRSAGHIEHGRRYTFTDAHDQVHPGYRSLLEAQDAATGSIAIIPTAHPDGGLQAGHTAAARHVAVKLALIPSAAVVGAAIAGGIALLTQLLLT